MTGLGSPAYGGRMRTEIRHPQSTHVPVGPSSEPAWELSLHRSLPLSMEEVWERLFDEWLSQWLGVDSVPQMVGSSLRHGEETRGRVIGCHAGRRLRVRWTPIAFDHETEFQVTLMDAALFDGVPSGTVLDIRQERLLGPAERRELLQHWTSVLDELTAALTRGTLAAPAPEG